MARLLSVNVGFPRDIVWKGRTVHTGVWKNPVTGRCRVGRLNLEGDGQGDLKSLTLANRHKNVILMVVNGGKMRTKGE